MIKIGLTGGIGSGKTTVCRVFRAMDVPVYEADKEARRLMESDEQIIHSIGTAFGSRAYLEGKLNRAYISELVFKDKALLSKLNAIVHPVVHQDFHTWSLNFSTEAYLIEEAAILFESGGAKKMDYTIFVQSNVQTRIERVMARDNTREEEVKERMNSQMNDIEKQNMADFIIFNEIGSMILPQIVDLHNRFLELNK